MTPDAINAWFTPFHYFVYLSTLIVGMVVFYQWKWAKICKENIQILIARAAGGGDFVLAKKDGNSISLEEKNGTTRTWLLSELATIDVLYPGVGFVPGFLQKTIRMAILNEGDWEPMLNRSPHRDHVASPDVVVFIQQLADDNPGLKGQIDAVLRKITTAPTRELIADPAMIGALRQSTIMKALATVSNDLLETLQMISRKLERKAELINPMVVYIALLLIIGAVGFAVYQGVVNAESIGQIKDALGIVDTTTLPKP